MRTLHGRCWRWWWPWGWWKEILAYEHRPAVQRSRASGSSGGGVLLGDTVPCVQQQTDALAGLRYAWPGASWRCWVGGPRVGTASMPSPYSRARTWLWQNCTLRYHRLHSSNLEPLPAASSRTILLSLLLHHHHLHHQHHPRALPTQPRACSCSSLQLERSVPCGHRQKKSISSPSAPPSPPTATSPPPSAPCDALPAFLLCPSSAPQRALRNETTPPRPRLYLRLREQLRPLARCLHPDARITVRASPQPLHLTDYSNCCCAS